MPLIYIIISTVFLSSSTPNSLSATDVLKDIQDNPKEIVELFCTEDSKGVRFSSATRRTLNTLIAWEGEPGWESISLIDSFSIITVSEEGNNAKVKVQYRVYGVLRGFNWEPNNPDEEAPSAINEIIEFNLSKIQDSWKIVEPVIQPHISIEAALSHFEQRKGRRAGRPGASQWDNAIASLKELIRLKKPENIPPNQFY